jgi:hypothetical protein
MSFFTGYDEELGGGGRWRAFSIVPDLCSVESSASVC